MKNKILSISVIFILVAFSANAQTKVVDLYGQLSVKGNYIMSQRGDTVQLRGMSLFWSQWMGQFYNESAVKWLSQDWKSTIVRAAMGVDMGGYLTNPDVEKKKVIAVVDAAIASGIYVIIDFHSHEAHKNTEEAKKFFGEMALKYGKYPNVLYELYNEPLKDVSWEKDIKPYEEAVLKEIRKHDPDNIVICGTRQWSQLVDEAASNPIKDANVVYTLHYYAATHKQWLRDEGVAAMKKGVALFVSEFGICDASGNGDLDLKESQLWFDFLDKYKISWCNWSLADKEEAASVLLPGSSGEGGWTNAQLTTAGKFIKNEMTTKNAVVLNKKRKK